MLNNIVSFIIAKQGNKSDSEYAKSLNIDRRTLGKTTAGEIPVGMAILSTILILYPGKQTEQKVIDYLKEIGRQRLENCENGDGRNH